MTNEQHIKELIDQATHVCRELTEHLHLENELIRSRQMDKVEEMTRMKTELVTTLESHLAKIKVAGEGVIANDALQPHMTMLKTAVRGYDKLARQNLVLLEASYQATTDFLSLVQQASTKPGASVYGQQGTVRESDGQRKNLVSKTL